MTNHLPAFPAPSPAYLREEVASWYGLTGKQLRRNLDARDHAAFLMSEHRIPWSKIARSLGYVWANSALSAARRWERMRRKP